MVRRSTVDRSPHSAEHELDYEAGTEYSGGDPTKRIALGANLGRIGRPLACLGLPWDRLGCLAAYRLPRRGRDPVERIELGAAGPGHLCASDQRVPGDPRGCLRPAVRAGVPELQSARCRAARSPPRRVPAQRADPQLGWNGQGTSVLQSEQVASTDVQDAHHAVVTLLARVNGQLMQLGVPVYASSDGLVVSSAPAWLPAPGRAALPTPANTGS